jgi:hypothetical protein
MQYSMTSTLQMEPHVDERIIEFIIQLRERFAETGKVCNLSHWAQWRKFLPKSAHYTLTDFEI